MCPSECREPRMSQMRSTWCVSCAKKPRWCSRGPAHHLRSEEHTSELQSRLHLVCRLLLEKKKLLRTVYAAAPPNFTPLLPTQVTPRSCIRTTPTFPLRLITHAQHIESNSPAYVSTETAY